MDEESRESVASTDGKAKRKARRVGRRTALKAGAAVVAGLALAETYVKPSVVSAFVEETTPLSFEFSEGSLSGKTTRRPSSSTGTTSTRTAPAPATDSARTGGSASTTKSDQ